MSTVDELKQVLAQADLAMNESKRSAMLHRLNVDPRWEIADRNFAAIGEALQLLAERIDALESR